MSKINWKQKLTSRKFGVSITGLATSIMVLTTLQGNAAQDNLAIADITAYVKKGQSYGLKDAGALIYFADGVNQYSVASSLWANISKDALKNTGDVEAMYAATKKRTNDYIPRRTTVYNKVKALGLNETPNQLCVWNEKCKNVISSIQ